MINNYEAKANEFLKAHGATIKLDYIGRAKYFDGDKQPRNIYKFVIKRNGKQYSAKFGDSLYNTECGKKPSAYDILACLTKYEPSSDILDFASEYGYTIYDREGYNRAKKIFNAVKREYNGVVRLFGDCLDELREIE